MAKEQIKDIYSTSTLEDFISVLFTQFAQGRKPYEEKWLECWWNFIGQYNPNNKLQTTEGQQHRSRVFIRLTQQKVRAATAKVMDTLGTEIPFRLVPLVDNPKIEFDLAPIANAQKDIIRNQFKKIDLRDTFDTAMLEMAIYGTAILKGPVIEEHIVEGLQENVRNVLGWQVPMWQIPFKDYPRWRRTYVKQREKRVYPVSIWDFYTDNNADVCNKSIGAMEKHTYSPYEFQQIFFGNPEYNQENVVAAYNMACLPEEYRKLEVQQGQNYMGEQNPKDLKVTVVEYWGQAPYALVKPHLKEVPEGVSNKDTDLVECAVELACISSETDVLSSIKILKANLNPSGDRIFKVCPYIKNPGSPWGIGVAESIRDSQKLINSFARLTVDNKALSGNGMFAINKEQIDTRATKDGLKAYPGKVYFVKGDVRQAIVPLSFPDVTGGLEVAMDRFERWADEESGIPKYSQGEAANSYLNKMLDIYTKVPMADGSYKLLRDIEDGDMIVGKDGMPTKVLKAHKIHFPERAYEIKFKSGETIVAGGEHLWTIKTQSPKWKTIDTDSLYEFTQQHKTTVFVPRVQRAYTGQEMDLPLDPYILGVWLGDGHTYAPRVTTPDAYIVERLKEFAKEHGGEVKKDKTQNAGLATTYYVDGLYKPLRDLGLLRKSSDDDKEGKHIPEIYFRASYSQRLELLRGLMDTDGCHHSFNLTIFTQKEGQLLEDVIRLIASLGGFPKKCKTNPGKMAKEGIKYFNVNFQLPDNPFHLPKKANKWKAPQRCEDKQAITSIKLLPDVRLMRCLTVDAEDGLFCVGERFTVTHNTASGMAMIINQSNIYLKATIRNIDEFWIKPIVKAFNYLNEVDGSYPTEINYPLDVVPMGVDSLMEKGVKFENAMQLFQVAKETDLLPYINKTNALRLVSDLLDVKGLVVSEIEAQQITQSLQAQAMQASQASLSANIGSDLLAALTAEERAQVLQKMGVQADPQSDAKLLIKKAQNLELDTQAKIMVNDRKELGKAQGKAADNILGSMLDQEKEEKMPQQPRVTIENTNEAPE